MSQTAATSSAANVRLPKLVAVPHDRLPWAGHEQVLVCTRYGRVSGTDSGMSHASERQRRYNAAKIAGNFDAAAYIVQEALRDSDVTLDLLIDRIADGLRRQTPIICVVPHPPFDDVRADGADLVGRPRVRNALPLQYAATLAETIGASMDSEIVQAARVGRTKLARWCRFLWQPSFVGKVRTDSVYILVDDVLTTGGTLAALRTHILRNGGTVAAYTTLAHGRGVTQPLALQSETWDKLYGLYGPDFDGFWKEEIGHGARCLTEAEGRHLVSWGLEQKEERGGNPSLQLLRDRLAEAAAKGQ